MMDRRALLFDVGNTRMKWGVLDRERIIRTGSIKREALRESGYNAVMTRLPRKVDSILVSNVAGPAFAAKLTGVLGIHCNADVHFARSGKAAFGISNSYREPRRMGIDRWVAMIGARAESKSALCVVDAGTAVTIDAIDRHGQHLGGQIIPGLHLMAQSLESDTSDIGAARRTGRDPGAGLDLFANTTQRAVRNGTLSAVCGAIERAVRVMRAEGLRPEIVLTGGDAPRILKQLGGNILHRPHLVLQGLAFMLREQQ